LGNDFSNGFLLEDDSPATELRGVAARRRHTNNKNIPPFIAFHRVLASYRLLIRLSFLW
jgi:hypothetical protein